MTIPGAGSRITWIEGFYRHKLQEIRVDEIKIHSIAIQRKLELIFYVAKKHTE
jgi:hypothetical protein